jgi:antitoxin component of MazEF toxin-antitoxin module
VRSDVCCQRTTSVALEADIDAGDAVDVSVENGAIVFRPGRPTYSLSLDNSLPNTRDVLERTRRRASGSRSRTAGKARISRWREASTS